jgi:hypothetical protein
MPRAGSEKRDGVALGESDGAHRRRRGASPWVRPRAEWITQRPEGSRVLSVEKRAEEEPSGRRCLEWVARHAGWTSSEGLQPVEQSGGYCWSFYFHTTPMLSLYRILHAPRPAKMAYARQHFRHFGVDQQYPGVLRCSILLLSGCHLWPKHWCVTRPHIPPYPLIIV